MLQALYISVVTIVVGSWWYALFLFRDARNTTSPQTSFFYNRFLQKKTDYLPGPMTKLSGATT